MTDTQKRLDALRLELEAKQQEIDRFEIEVDEDMYDEMLDDVYEEVNVGVTLNASRVLKECDPIAYRCGMNDYADSLDVEDDEDYQELIEERDSIQEFIDEAEAKLEDEEDE